MSKGRLYDPRRGTLYRDERGVVHETRIKRMTIFLCEERDGHRDYGACDDESSDPTIAFPTCLECLVQGDEGR